MSQDINLYYEPADKRIECRALNITEELGQIQYVMSDKTGTLTENQMLFRRCSIAGRDFGPNIVPSSMSIGRLTHENARHVDTDVELVRLIATFDDKMLLSMHSNDAAEQHDESYDDNCDIYDFFCNMAICNTVIVTARHHHDHLDDLQAESPDELSLVYAADAYGVRLLERHLNQVIIELNGEHRLAYKILDTLPFDSERKRMSVIVQTPFDDTPILYCKGADTAIFSVLSDEFAKSNHGQNVIFKSEQHLNLYSSYGLRTLCLAKRRLTDSEYRKWKSMHEIAEMAIENREILLIESAMRIEIDLQLIGVTGIEDRLQDGVPECIAALRQSGIKV